MHVRLHELSLEDGHAAVLAGVVHATPWSRFDYIELAPGQEHRPPHGALPAEEAFVLLSGGGEAHAALSALETAAPDVLLALPGARPVLRNSGGQMLCALHVAVDLPAAGPARGAPPSAAETWRREALDRARLSWRPAIHGGRGRMAARHLWSSADFVSAWTYLDHAVLGPLCSLGRHCHEAGEEAFVVLRGAGRMVIGGAAFAVGPGSATFQGVGQAHALDNTGPDELEFVRIAVALAERAFTTTDLPAAPHETAPPSAP